MMLQMLRDCSRQFVTLSATALLLLAQPAVADEYVALGDSFASGNGTNNPDLDYICYRSSDAYAPIIAEERPNTTLKFVACGGAVTDDVLTQQVSALSTTTDYVTLSIVGKLHRDLQGRQPVCLYL